MERTIRTYSVVDIELKQDDLLADIANRLLVTANSMDNDADTHNTKDQPRSHNGDGVKANVRVHEHTVPVCEDTDKTVPVWRRRQRGRRVHNTPDVRAREERDAGAGT